jgi:hypothetical protein
MEAGRGLLKGAADFDGLKAVINLHVLPAYRRIFRHICD